MSDHEDPHAWWWDLPDEERERFDRLAQRSLLELDCYPYASAEGAAELLAWADLEGDITEAHIQWLTRTKSKFERNGWPWTTEELRRRSRLWEVE